MSSFTALRVLVTLVVATTLMSTPSVGRPLPSPSPISLKFASRQLLSTSSTLPLPPMIIAEQRRAASFTQQRPEPILLKRRDVDDVAPRFNIHEHVHEHSHDHDREHDYPDRWTKDEMDHHSDHWAWHHGLLHEHEDNDHAHIHEHTHDHKREAEESLPSEDLTERGLIDDLGNAVRPLLAPLEILPGFVTIENFLFGDGDQDDGLLKTVGGLLLKVQPPKDEQSPSQYEYSLLASKHDRTQVYLAPVNDTSDAGCEDDTNGDVLTVRVKLPLMDMKGSAIEMCASVGNAPPSAMSLESCRQEETTENMSMNGTSQFFTYTRSTGSLTPILMSIQGSDMKVNTLDAQDGASNTTTDDAGTSQDPTKSKMLMHFTLFSNSTDSGMEDSSAGTDDSSVADQTSEPMTRRQTTDGSTDGTTDTSLDASIDSTDDESQTKTTDTAADSDDSNIFLAVTLLNNGSSYATTSSSSPSKLCKAKM